MSLGERKLPLAFIYDGSAYYFDLDCFDDAYSTIVVSGSETTSGREANEALLRAVRTYGEHRGSVWIAKWFKDCVAYELEHGQER